MTVKKIAWFDTEKWEKQYLKNKNPDLEIEYFEQPLNTETVEKIDESFDAVTVFVSSQVDEKVLEKLSVDIVACRSTGFDNVNLEASEKHGIKVCNVPAYGATTVAEHTFGLILTISRRINEAIDKVENGEFNHRGLKGFDLEGKTLGVIGTGGIGKEVIRIADGFNMNIIASDPYPDKESEQEMPFMYVSREHLLKKADIITLHCPLTKETRHMLSTTEFEKMEETVLINTSRGGLIDTEALIKALENNNLSHAGLDVLEEECMIDDDIEMINMMDEECHPQKLLEDHILMDREDAIITPHNAFNSKEALERIEDQTLENLCDEKNIVN